MTDLRREVVFASMQELMDHHRAVEEQKDMMGCQLAVLIRHVAPDTMEFEFERAELEAMFEKELTLLSMPQGDDKVLLRLVPVVEAQKYWAAMEASRTGKGGAQA